MSLFALIVCLIGSTLTEYCTTTNNEKQKRILNKKNLVHFLTFKGLYVFKT